MSFRSYCMMDVIRISRFAIFTSVACTMALNIRRRIGELNQIDGSYHSIANTLLKSAVNGCEFDLYVSLLSTPPSQYQVTIYLPLLQHQSSPPKNPNNNHRHPDRPSSIRKPWQLRNTRCGRSRFDNNSRRRRVTSTRSRSIRRRSTALLTIRSDTARSGHKIRGRTARWLGRKPSSELYEASRTSQRC